MKYFLFTVVLLIFSAASVRSQSKRAEEVSSLEALSKDEALTLYYGMRYIRFEHQLSPDLRNHLNKLHTILPGFNKLPEMEGLSWADFLNRTKAKKEEIYQRFEDKTRLVADLKSYALILGQMPDENSSKLAVYLLDYLSKIYPEDPGTAYERERIAFEKGISSNWNEEDRMINRIEIIGSNSGVMNLSGLSKRQSVVKGLLVQRLKGSQFIGESSQMNATLVDGDTGNPGMAVKYNQYVGRSMIEAVDKMLAFQTKRHPDLPTGVKIELSFAEQYIPKDGPSAGVANALLIESIVEGCEYDSGFAVTGALDATGKVEPVGGIGGKIRGAIGDKCRVVAIPHQNEQAVVDTLILEGISNLANIQIIGISDFDDALSIALHKKERDETIQTALDLFEEVQTAINLGNTGTLSNQAIQQKLRQVLTAIPRHYSAKYLLLESVGKRPKNLGLIASVQVIDQCATPLMEMLEEEDFGAVDSLKKDRIAESIAMLNRMRPYLDQRTKPCSDAIVDYSGHLRTAFYSPPNSGNSINRLIKDLNSTGRAISKQYEALFARDDVKKELFLD